MEQTLEIAGTLVGLLYLWLEYRASIYLWIAGIIMPAIYLFVYYEAGLYADFGINIYYLGAAVYGWTMWKYGAFLRRKILRQNVLPSKGSGKEENGVDRKKQELHIAHMPKHYLLPLAIVFAVTLVGIAWILIDFTDSNVPWLDSFTTALSIIGMWMLARKYVEQWWAWIGVDVVSACLYIYKGLDFTAGLYALYAIIAVFGYFKWKRMMSETRN
ncbi:nicotinamide mononucleotide transporter [Bacteroides zoogleoformans]|uniref:Nicotinamide riboside transporter PnuC n=1 Tax=Bacteroides zoogleoformans TaxID=28119 RepID=A0ABN5IJM5_9BACE|nr:nicotinamide riboside transporter PnuC [Bacteroides zoogleoformans]AVM52834.1 nicotinamide riboside transporter PnuC [Bacteroides zoogleoformans]TWJ18646.1 nicotinamide mononucleotide transporter [Bacteroides zoogleoformans]